MIRRDVVVVGAGYAGLAAAAQLAGRSVSVLERQDSVMERRRGSLGLLLPLGARALVRGDGLYFRDLDLLVEGALRHRLRRLVVRGLRERLELTLSKPLLVMSESRLKGALLHQVLEHGGEVVVGCPVRQVEVGRELSRVRAEDDYQARVVVGADGSSSLVSRSLGVRRGKRGMLFQRQYQVERLELQRDTLLIQLNDYRQMLLAYYDGENYRASLLQFAGPRGNAGELDDTLQDWVERLGAGRVLNAFGATVRLLEPAGDCCRPNALLAGDALAFAGFASITGAMAMGALAGKVAGRLLAGSGYALTDYHKQWRRVSGQPQLERLAWLAPLWRRCDGQRIDRLLGRLHDQSGRLPPGANLLWRLPALLWDLLV